MPVIEHENLRIDFNEAGEGDLVVLVHSSVSGNRQWKRLTQVLQPRFRVVAVNLFGYGETSAWHGDTPQTITDQANLVLRLVRDSTGPVRLVGHSFGGAVATRAAALLGQRASHLVLFEPTLFHLLAQNGRHAAHADAMALRDFIKFHGARQDWCAVAERFVNYWIGDGAWAALPEEKQLAYRQLLPPNYHEWDGLGTDPSTLADLANSPARALFMHTPGAPRPIRELAQLFEEQCPRWKVVQLTEGGHMAPLTHPDLVNPLIAGFLAEDTRMEAMPPLAHRAIDMPLPA